MVSTTHSNPAEDNETEDGVDLSDNKRSREIRIFQSFEEQEDYELGEMAKLSSPEILRQMRKLVNLAYGMHGYDPSKLPKVHKLTFGKPKSAT